jgi:hypothetical protein
VANTDPKNEHAGDSEYSPPMEGAGGIASFIVAMFNHYRYRLALFPNNQSIRRRSNCQRDAASLYVVAVEGSSVYVNEKVTELFSL